jgi:cellulose synthase/poly-beta-1,6-N-acetylglucosamine synthase-like glycosyltransferase
MRGKDSLGLFVHLRGSCQFIRRSVLNELGGFDEHALSEDMALSVRLAEKGYRIRYASDSVSLQESPASWIRMVKQRTRWFRGTMEVALKYGRLMARPNARRIDAEATLFGPFILIFSTTIYLGVFLSLLFPFRLDSLSQTIMQFAGASATITLLGCGLALIYASRPRRVKSIYWVVFIYVYWFLQAFVAAYAFLSIVFRRPRTWLKTEKTGVMKPAETA